MEQEQQPALMPIMAYFSAIRDPRIERNKLYPLYEVIVITILIGILIADDSLTRKYLYRELVSE